MEKSKYLTMACIPGLIIAVWMFFTNTAGLVYFTRFCYVSEIQKLHTWSGTALSMISTLILLFTNLWTFMAYQSKSWIIGTPIGLFFQLVGVISLSVANHEDSDFELTEEQAHHIHDHGIQPGTELDVKAMIHIVATISDLYNWLLTVSLIFVMALLWIPLFIQSIRSNAWKNFSTCCQRKRKTVNVKTKETP